MKTLKFVSISLGIVLIICVIIMVSEIRKNDKFLRTYYDQSAVIIQKEGQIKLLEIKVQHYADSLKLSEELKSYIIREYIENEKNRSLLFN